MATLKTSWWDDFIGFFSPKAKSQRLRYKLYNNFVQRKYEGAGVGRRTAGWKTATKSANSEIAVAQTKLRDRSRDLVRNNPYATKGLQTITSHVVGRGIMTQFKARQSRRERQLNDTWRAWAGTTACDYEGIHDLMGLQRLVMRSIVESGEAVVRIRRVERQEARGPDGVVREVPPIQIQVLESDFIASTLLQGALTTDDGNRIIQGIEIDENDKRVAYHLFEDHPGSFNIVPISKFSTVRIPANEILHPYRMDRPGQLRGVPWLAPIMIRLRDFDEYEDAQLVRQKIAAMFTAFIHDLEGLDDIPDSTDNKQELGEKMEPGIIEILPPGKDIKLANPPGVQNYDQYTSVVLHSIASGLGITYESLTGNLSEVNFSSARMGALEMNRNVDAWRWQMFVPQFLRPVSSWFLGGADLLGMNITDVRTVFTAPKRELVDPTKEIPALRDAVRSGFTTLSETVRMHGQDPDTHFEEIQADNKRLDDLNLTLDTDPRKDAEQLQVEQSALVSEGE